MSVQLLKQTHVIPTPYVLIRKDPISVDALMALRAMAKTAQVSDQICGGFFYSQRSHFRIINLLTLSNADDIMVLF